MEETNRTFAFEPGSAGNRQNPGDEPFRLPVGEEEIREAGETLKKYKAGKASLEARIIENEEWYRLRHWGILGKSKNPGDPEPASAWLLNALLNKHADAMDNYPEPCVLPREEGDREDARILSDVLPVILEQNDFRRTYSKMWWYKLRTGTGLYGVTWDPSANHGLGDVSVKSLDLLNLFWEPGVDDLQDSRNLFYVRLEDSESLAERYPCLRDTVPGQDIELGKYVSDDSVDTSDKTVVADWYYKVLREGKTRVHYCRFACGKVLYASENDPLYAERGFYDHGQYPFVTDPLFPVPGSPAGFGYLDIMKSPQMYIDKLDSVILKHAVMSSRPRFWVKGDGKVDEKEFADWQKDFVHFQGVGSPEDSVFPIQIPNLSDMCTEVRGLKIEELKETSGNRDFNQGGTVGGVTAATAISALQEAGSKLSRDMISASYDAFTRVNYLVLELVRQFYEEPRCFRITGKDGGYGFESVSGKRLRGIHQGRDFGQDMGYRVPVFDIVVTSQKKSPFSTAAQNERAKELYSMGFFRPDLADQSLAALEMMDFDGIEQVRRKISENAALVRENEKLKAALTEVTSFVDGEHGTNLAALISEQSAAGTRGTAARGEGSQGRRKSAETSGDPGGERVAGPAAELARLGNGGDA